MSKTNDKPKTATKGGVVHADNRGSIGKAIENSDAGRARKKQEQHARERAWAKKNIDERLKQHQQLEQEFNFLSQDYDALVAGDADNEYGLRLTKSFNNHSALGIIKMVIVLCGREKKWPAIQVTGSTFDPIPASSIFMPLNSLLAPTLKNWGQPQEIWNYQTELHAALRHYLKKEIGRMKPPQGPTQEMIVPQFNRKVDLVKPSASVPHVKPQPSVMKKEVAPAEEVEVDVSEAIPLCAAAFLRKKESSAPLYRHVDTNGAAAYFRAERIAGVQSLVLEVCEEKHVLDDVFCEHERIYVHLQELPKSDHPYDPDMKVKKNAREKLRQYLRRAGMSLGVHPKRQTTMETVEAKMA